MSAYIVWSDVAGVSPFAIQRIASSTARSPAAYASSAGAPGPGGGAGGGAGGPPPASAAAGARSSGARSAARAELRRFLRLSEVMGSPLYPPIGRTSEKRLRVRRVAPREFGRESALPPVCGR